MTIRISVVYEPRARPQRLGAFLGEDKPFKVYVQHPDNPVGLVAEYNTSDDAIDYVHGYTGQPVTILQVDLK